jgi:glutamate-1-semialdehyde 2,1-aminomutase
LVPHYTQADFDTVCDRFVAAAKAMHGYGWWWHDPALTDRAIRRGVLRETLRQFRTPRRGG